MSVRAEQLSRIAWLVAPTTLAFSYVAASLDRTELRVVILYTVGPLLIGTLVAMYARAVDVLYHRRGIDACLASLDVLTTNGRWTITTSAGAVALSVCSGWASLSVLGVLGLSVVHVLVLWALLCVCGDDPWRRTSLRRRFVPARALQGDPVTEELRFDSPRIPVGFRLFSSGRVGPRWPTSREVLAAGASGGETVVTRDVGPAVRGVYAGEPIEVWLEDMLGLVRSRHDFVDGGASPLTVLPRAPRADGARPVCRRRGDDHEAETVLRLPTEGCLNLREYQAGDDARRIHWMRSLGRREIVVRLPDEVPPEMPSVELVLDTFQVSIADWSASSEGPHVLLDALVQVWLGLGHAMVEAGIRVVLVVACRKSTEDRSIVPLCLPLDVRSFAPAELGARVEWQGVLAATDMWTSRSIVVSHRPPSVVDHDITRRVIVPPEIWAPDARGVGLTSQARTSILRLPYPVGAAENSRSEARALRTKQRPSLDLEALFWATTAQSRPRPPLASGTDTRFWVTPAGARAAGTAPRSHGRDKGAFSAPPFVARPIDAAHFRIEELR